jgi:FHS family L-fucose permease-like MFS transporter
MAFPAAMFIRKHSYKSGLLIGLALYAIGALMFIPAAGTGNYYPFLIAYFVLTCGLSFLETSANPFILSLGDKASATRRLNLAQSFNPIGSLAGMWVAMNFIQARMNPLGTSERAVLPDAEFEALKAADLAVVVKPYVAIGVVIVALLLLMMFTKMPRAVKTGLQDLRLRATIGRLWRNATYRCGVLAQFFYVGAQITCWTFIIQYGTQVFMAEGMGEQAAEIASQRLNIIAMVLFASSRFICTWLMQWFSPSRMLSVMGIIGVCALVGVVGFTDRNGIYCLVAVSGSLSLMFPTIYGLAVKGLGDNIKIAGAGLVMAIFGGSLFPPIQAAIIESGIMLWGLPSINLSFVIPLTGLSLVIWYGHRTYVRNDIRKEF